MSLLRCMAVHQHVSGLPRDRVVNTFHFETGNETELTAEIAAEAVRDFYVSTLPNNIKPLMDEFGPSIALTGHEVRVYPLDIATGADTRGLGAPPLWVEAFDHVGRVAPADGHPSEVAICLSYRNLSAGSVPPARRRGRIYFGPLADQGGVSQVAAGVVRPSSILAALRAAGEWLQEASPMAGNWRVYSRPYEGRDAIVREGKSTLPALPARPGAVYLIEEVSADDSFDTQRRRGERPTTRYTTAITQPA